MSRRCCSTELWSSLPAYLTARFCTSCSSDSIFSTAVLSSPSLFPLSKVIRSRSVFLRLLQFVSINRNNRSTNSLVSLIVWSICTYDWTEFMVQSIISIRASCSGMGILFHDYGSKRCILWSDANLFSQNSLSRAASSCSRWLLTSCFIFRSSIRIWSGR